MTNPEPAMIANHGMTVPGRGAHNTTKTAITTYTAKNAA